MATAATAEEGAPATAEPKKRKMSGKKLVLFILLPVLLLGGGGAAAYFFLLKKSPEQIAAEKAAAAATPPTLYYVEMAEIQANLVSTSKRNNFLRLTLWLEVGSDDDTKKIGNVMPLIVDQF